MVEFCYGSFNRPLDFIIGNELPFPVEVRHNLYPLKRGQPHSMLISSVPLACQDMYRFELTLLDIWEMTISDLKELWNPDPFPLPIDAHTIIKHNNGRLYLEICGDDADICDIFDIRDGSHHIEIENVDTGWLISIPAGSTLREMLKAAREIL